MGCLAVSSLYYDDPLLDAAENGSDSYDISLEAPDLTSRIMVVDEIPNVSKFREGDVVYDVQTSSLYVKHNVWVRLK